MMKLRNVFSFELAYQIRSPFPWLVLAAVLANSIFGIRSNAIENARAGEFLLNSSFAIAVTTLFCCLIWVVLGAPIAGAAAARDVQMRMHPLTFTTPVRKLEYLGGRFLAALVLNALILLAALLGILLALLIPGLEPAILGPHRPFAYLSVYLFIALPVAFVCTAIQFSFAALNHRVMAAYLGTLLLLIFAYPVSVVFWDVQHLTDPIGSAGTLNALFDWTVVERNTVMVGPQSFIVANRLIWLTIAVAVIVFTYARYRFKHDAGARPSFFRRRRRVAHSAPHEISGIVANEPISIPRARQTFGLATNVRQMLFIARTSFLTMAISRLGFLFAAGLAFVAAARVANGMQANGGTLFPTTGHTLDFLTAPLANNPDLGWFIIPLLILFYAGELVWREREARLSEITNTVPVREWVLFSGKFLALSLLIVSWLAVLMAAAVLVQASGGYTNFEIGLYLQVLFGIQLANYLQFAVLALAVHVLVDEKYIGHLVGLASYGFLAAGATAIGIEHNLLVYGADPGWTYTDMRGFGASLAPWLWFKFYWAAWALLIGLAASLLWVRSTEQSFKARLRQARHRLRPPVLAFGAVAAALPILLGGFIFYNTNILNDYQSASEIAERKAAYEKRYAQYKNVAQPELTDTKLRVELYPERHEADIRGTYNLVNKRSVPIDTIHVATAPEVDTGRIAFDRLADALVVDQNLGYRIYRLEKPLRPGESLRLSFSVHFDQSGFGNSGADVPVVPNGTYFTNAWLPAIGYQSDRTLSNPQDRKDHGLPPRPVLASLYDRDSQRNQSHADRTTLDAVIGTNGDEVAVVQGSLRRAWSENGRRYFRYSTNTSIGNDYAILSGRYAVHEERWKDITIRILYYPAHDKQLERMASAVRESLNYYSEQFGPYPHSHITIAARASEGGGLNADGGSMVDYGELYSQHNIDEDERGYDHVFAVMGHEIAHSWWGAQVTPARVEGGGILVESLAWYSAMRLVEETHGPQHLRQLISFFLEDKEAMQARAAPPLLQAGYDRYQNYRKGPLALYAISEYVGKERLHAALRRLIQRHGSGAVLLPTTLDLYRELKAVTPPSLQYLLHDMFKANTFWELETEKVTSKKVEGQWQVTLDVRARKLVVDTQGAEKTVPMNDLIEVAVFGVPSGAGKSSEPIYLKKHRIGSGTQSITVAVTGEPERAGIDPNRLLFDTQRNDNIRQITGN
ncbi:MAG: ABC transporter permease [Sphingomonas sp.]|nr:ABC transporter permease [Sphingomonas sp.]